MARGFDSKKKRGNMENLDMISNLPQEVTDEILKRLPIRDVVKTSVLSTKWRYRWNSITELVFDHGSIEEVQYKEDLVKVVNNVLLLHNNAVISKFVLNEFLEKGCSDVDPWIVVLSRSKMLYHLVLAFKECSSYKLPACLFSCENLRTLKLKECILRLPSQYKGFSHLTDLELNLVNIASETFQTLVAKIPLLKQLKVLECPSLTHINVHAPNLNVVVIIGLYTSINFQNTPNLTNINLWLAEVTCWVDQGHGRLHELQAVDVNFPNTESFPIEDVPVVWNTTYHHLKCARLLLEDSSQILAVLSLLKISPCLEMLDIRTYGENETVHHYEEHFWDERLLTKSVFHHLKTVQLSGLTGLHHEMGFIQFILLNAVVLETFHIYWRLGTYGVTDNKKERQNGDSFSSSGGSFIALHKTEYKGILKFNGRGHFTEWSKRSLRNLAVGIGYTV
ncbi:F-box/FBD/LRR-repeat protein [Thalictrum thalictroides]|uniref:F-box/FBD/LRR-repeat protein n=1 Tax=Thalictrum thalictroides TaxID=46969 RepID=A0A7J6XAM5_THATH|nr:F-box/FBD/LRR-repeat protein [Thalictrum thalictroides]